MAGLWQILVYVALVTVLTGLMVGARLPGERD